jgi:ribonuclease HII
VSILIKGGIQDPRVTFLSGLHDRNNKGLLVGGVDEAGRGSVLGPLVVAGISVRESGLPLLRQLGVRDSKLISPRTRASLFGKLLNIAESVSVIKVPPADIDESVFVRGLNRLEARIMAEVVNDLDADEVYVDCCDVNPERYKESMSRHLFCKSALHSMHHADSLNVVVGAASIIAKITRDQEVSEIRKRYRNIGSGYPSDEKTMLFIKRWISKNGVAPDFARKSWKPLRIMLARHTGRSPSSSTTCLTAPYPRYSQ